MLQQQYKYEHEANDVTVTVYEHEANGRCYINSTMRPTEDVAVTVYDHEANDITV